MLLLLLFAHVMVTYKSSGLQALLDLGSQTTSPELAPSSGGISSHSGKAMACNASPSTPFPPPQRTKS